MSTTYLTSTLTGLLEALRRLRWSDTHPRSLGILATALAGAAVATALILHAPRWLPAIQLVPMIVVILGSLRLISRQGAAPEEPRT
jgi:hypothetical protein